MDNRNSRVRFSTIVKNNNDILFYISTENYEEFTKLITEANVNNIIDSKNSYTAIHYSIKFNNEKMMEYLLNMGANPYLKTLTGEDAFDLSLKYQTKYVIVHQLNNLKETNKELNKTISSLHKKINDLDINNKYLIKSYDDLIDKFSELKKENNLSETNNEYLKKDIKELKETNILLKCNNDELDSKINSLKRKYDELDKSYCGLLNKMRKN